MVEMTTMTITPTTTDDELLRLMRAGDARAFDPRSGDYVYRLEGLKRGEPDAALFTVPSDYKVHEVGEVRNEVRRELRRELRVPGKKDE
ncbi:MAG: hypothetical protein JWP72_3985 [Massilia sp.]|nr:hypothetical protein [Massilia sp.]MDB5790138.1 hypothetical protein [Massilia sp.]